VDDLRARIAEALMAWAESNNAPKYASFRRPQTVVDNAYSRADAVMAVVRPALDDAEQRFERLHVDYNLALGQRDRAVQQVAAVREFCALMADSCHVPSRTTARDILRYLDTGNWCEVEPAASSGIRGLLEHVGIDMRGKTITVDGAPIDEPTTEE
jgi:hypothetical protein